MDRLNPDKISVEFRSVSPTEPVLGRKYTQTHSDITAELFVTIGLQFAYDKINTTRDEVLAEWRQSNDNRIYLWTYVYVGDYGPIMTEFRYNIFRRELPLALAAIRYADKTLFMQHSELDNAPIYIYFDSTYANFSGWYNYGSPADYLNYYRL